MADNNTKPFKVGDAEITLLARPKNKHRELLRQVYRKVAAAKPMISASTAQEFATIVTYTISVKGDIWTPPSAYATDEEISAALDTWLEDVDEALTERWLDEIEKK